MRFSIKQLLLFALVAGLCLAALLNAGNLLVPRLSKLSVALTFVFIAYGAWATRAEMRAFRVGFLFWGGTYYVLYVIINSERFDIGALYLPHYLVNMFHPKVYVRDAQGNVTGVFGNLLDQFAIIGHCVLSLLFGLVGGWVTVYFYRKRQRMLEGKC